MLYICSEEGNKIRYLGCMQILEIFCLNKLLCRDMRVDQDISQKDLSFFLIICFLLAVIILPAIVSKIPSALICHKSQRGLTNLENLGVIVQILLKGVNNSEKVLGFKQWALTSQPSNFKSKIIQLPKM